VTAQLPPLPTHPISDAKPPARAHGRMPQQDTASRPIRTVHLPARPSRLPRRAGRLQRWQENYWKKDGSIGIREGERRGRLVLTSDLSETEGGSAMAVAAGEDGHRKLPLPRAAVACWHLSRAGTHAPAAACRPRRGAEQTDPAPPVADSHHQAGRPPAWHYFFTRRARPLLRHAPTCHAAPACGSRRHRTRYYSSSPSSRDQISAAATLCWMAPIDMVARLRLDTGARSIDRCRRDAGIVSVQGARVAVRESKKEMGELRLAERVRVPTPGGASVSVVSYGSSNETPGGRRTCSSVAATSQYHIG
jgi:hypothetical protein